MTLGDKWRTFRSPKAAANEPLRGISLKVEEKLSLRLGPDPGTAVEELEIGAIGPSELQFVLVSPRRRATVKLSAEQARWLAGALNHWAGESETIALR
jgi:hypothetical protein